MNKLIILLIVMLIFAFGSGIGAATTISVDDDGTANYSTIKAAVNNASSGDEIIVKPGTYTENIRISTQKPNLIIKSESGNPENTIIKANPNTSVFNIAASNTTISGFKIESGEAGIYLAGCSDCTVTNNDLSDNEIGISLYIANYNEISGNRANSNKIYGIHLVSSEGNMLSSNSANSNERGINFITSNKNTILSNNVSNNSAYGMWISQSNDNKISGNTANETSRGISLDSSSDNTVSENIVAFNSVSGFYECPACHRNLVFNNYANNVRNANINSRDTTWNITKTNGTNIVGGPYIGGNFWAKPDSTGHSQVKPDANRDGFTDSAYIDSSENVADYLPLAPVSNPLQPILPVANFSTNVTEGYAPLSVQFNDSSENAARWSWDFDSDGSSDSPDQNPVHTYQAPGNYTVNLTTSNGNGTDSKLATINVSKQPVAVFPVADFTSNVTEGYAPLSVQFTELSQYATSRSWDFNNDGQSDSNESSPVYVYTASGTYTVNLTTINVNGTSSKTTSITVTEHGSSRGGSSGGGAGGSPEPAKNVEVKEISQTFISNDKNIKFDFAKNATCVVYVNFDAKKTVGKTTAIVEMLKEKSSLVSELPSGEVYRSFNIWVGNGGYATSENIENSTIYFKVEKSWIQEKNINKSSITFNRYDEGKWEQLPVSLSEEDDRFLYFTAQTPGFSFFAITGKNEEEETAVTDSQPGPQPGSKANDLNGENTDVINRSNVERALEKRASARSPGFETVYGVISLLALFLYKKVKPGN